MNQSQSNLSQILNNVSKATFLAIVLYPLDRIQTVKQIQSSYSNTKIKNQKNISTLCTHFGLRGMFRGLSPYILKGSSLLILMNIAQKLEFSNLIYTKTNKMIQSFIFSALTLTGYLLFYPLQIVKVRMTADVQRNRYYGNLRDCISKIKKNQGLNKLYRGCTFATFLFLLQANLLKSLYNKVIQYKHSEKDNLLKKLPGNSILQFFGCLIFTQLLLYPGDTIKKNYQINGALGHTANNFSIKETLKINSKYLYSGFIFRLTAFSFYSFLYLFTTEKNQKKAD